MINKTSTWDTPVELKLQCGLTRTFREAYDALYFLEEEWPIRHGASYERAKRWCSMALETQGAADIARKTFIEAARKAGLLVESATQGAGADHHIKSYA